MSYPKDEHEAEQDGRMAEAEGRGRAGSLVEALQREIRRVRDDVLPMYLEIGASGAFAVAGMRRDLDGAVKALADQNAAMCLLAYNALSGWHP